MFILLVDGNRIVACVGDKTGIAFLRGLGCKPLFLRPPSGSYDVDVLLSSHVNLRQAWVDVGRLCRCHRVPACATVLPPGSRITLSMYWSGVSPVEAISSSIAWVRLLSVPAVRPPVLKPLATSDLSNFFYSRPVHELKQSTPAIFSRLTLLLP